MEENPMPRNIRILQPKSGYPPKSDPVSGNPFWTEPRIVNGFLVFGKRKKKTNDEEA